MIRRVLCAHDEAAMRGRPKAELVLSEAEREERGHQALRKGQQREPEALRVEQDRRRHPCQRRALLSANF